MNIYFVSNLYLQIFNSFEVILLFFTKIFLYFMKIIKSEKVFFFQKFNWKFNFTRFEKVILFFLN
jgi:hypothetical protein